MIPRDRPAVPRKQRGDLDPWPQPDQPVHHEYPQGTPLRPPDRQGRTAPRGDGPAAGGPGRAEARRRSDRHRPPEPRSTSAEGDGASLEDFLRAELAEVVGKRGGDDRTSTDVVLYGFGRIGRLLARILIEKAGGGDGLRLRAIVVRSGSDNDLVKRASLLRRDSVHGPFEGTITVDEENNTIIANGNLIQVIYADDPADGRLHRRTASTTPSSSTTPARWRDARGPRRSTCRHRASPGSS